MSRIRHQFRPASRPFWTIFVTSLLGLALASCASSPQVVWVSPALAGPPDKIAQRRTVEVMVRDDRSSKVIGTLGGEADAPTISTQEDVSSGLVKIITEQLEEQGYSVVPSGSGGEVVLIVTLEELEYAARGSLPTEVELSSSVGVTSTNGNETLTSRYRTKHKEEFAMGPDDEDNSELVNLVVG